MPNEINKLLFTIIEQYFMYLLILNDFLHDVQSELIITVLNSNNYFVDRAQS